MGLADVLRGMQHGPHGPREPATTTSSGGLSPIAMAVLGLIAYKAAKQLGGSKPQPAGATTANAPGSGQADLSKGGLGGLLAGGAAAGSVLSSGLNDLLKQFQQKGHSEVANSWVGTGENKQISPTDLSKVLSEDQIKMLSEKTGLPREELIAGLSKLLPEVVNHLTPSGRLPTEQEASRML